jgi:hypothetical protein
MDQGTRHRWKFFRAGGFDQIRLSSGMDLLHLDELDQKLWVALACPTRGLEFDSRTLDLIDTDKDGRIRAPEIIAAAKWAAQRMKNPDIILQGRPNLPLADINDSTPEGKQLHASARQILVNLGKSDASAISVDDTTDTVKIFAQTKFNGDGIVPVECTANPAVQAVIKDIIACLGAETDRSGKPGINQAKADQFFAEAQAYVDWHKVSDNAPAIMFLGADTHPAADAFCAVRAKVIDYFARSRLAAFDPRALAALNRGEGEYLALAAKELSINAEEFAGFPLARVDGNRRLPLVEGVNPAWAGALDRFCALVVKPLLGDRTVLTEADWNKLCGILAPYETWQAAKKGAVVEKLGIARLREILAGPARGEIATLIAQDVALEPEANGITAVDKLVRLNRDLDRLLRNFVSFEDFYDRDQLAVFQAGSLYLDQRSCELCIRVEDMGRHAALAVHSRAYLAYCDCVRKATGEKITIVAAITGGDSDNLMVGRNGLFYDRNGNDWDATITKIVENPISIRQAIWSPYKKFLRLVEQQIEKFAVAKEKSVEAAASTHVAAAGAAVAEGKVAVKKEAFDVAKFAGIFAAIGLAIGAIGGAIGAMLGAFSRLALWQMPLAVLGMMILISGPSVIIAWLKLRQRNIGPILDANGWAVNTRAKINIPFGGALTEVATLPPGSDRDLLDPFAEKHTSRNLTILLLILLGVLWGCWYFGCGEKYFPGKLPKSGWMLRQEQNDPSSPAPVQAAPAPAKP